MKPNGTYCSRHRPTRHESQLSALNAARVKWYRRERAKLLRALGGACVDCGAVDELEFDELVPRPTGMPRPNRTSRWQRLRNYLKLWRMGLAAGIPYIALRCRTCNSQSGAPTTASPHDNHPF